MKKMNVDELLREILPSFLEQPPWKIEKKLPCGQGKPVLVQVTGLTKALSYSHNIDEVVKEERSLKVQLGYRGMVEHVNERVTADALIGRNELSTTLSLNRKTEHRPLTGLLETLLAVPCYKVTESNDFVPDFLPNEDSSIHPNLKRPICILDIPNAVCLVNSESLADEEVVTLWDCTSFSPAVLSMNHSKLLFVVYQMLSALQYCLEHSFIPTDLRLDSFLIDANGWTQLDVQDCLMRDLATNETERKERTEKGVTMETSELFNSADLDVARKYQCLCVRPMWELTTDWVKGKLSNFDYLMCLNKFAGKKLNDALNHPVLPWVCDFSLPEGGWRDLSKTKYRLAKGDQQLDQSYSSVYSCTAPHHIPEFLSDLGYYMYKARITSRRKLCKHVRSNWVPEEYPATIRRLYEWTPDECIPEFYMDPEIFESIHKDMPDLELPTWCPSGEEFVAWHRNMLECHWVSQRLHNWIDLVFGYKLSGEAAVKAKNVQLSLVDRHQEIKRHGVVQLFLKPHPAKQIQASHLVDARIMDEAADLVMNPLYELSQKPAESFEVSSEPFDLVSLAEAIYRTQKENQRVNAVEDCLASLGVVLVELCLSRDLKCLPRSSHWKDRFSLAKRLYNEKLANVPRCLRRGIRVLLQLGMHETGKKSPLTRLQLTPGLLLQPLVDIFPFPHYFPLLHECLGSLRQIRMNLASWFVDVSPGINPETLRDLAENQVRALAEFLPLAVSSLSLDMVKMVAESARQLFINPWTSVLAVWFLFNPLAQYLGEDLTNEYFGKALSFAYDVEMPCTQKHVKLYHRSFLLQLSVRMGTREFVTEIVPFLVEAAAGTRDSLAMDEMSYVKYFKESAASPPHFHRHLSEREPAEKDSETGDFLSEAPDAEGLNVQFELEIEGGFARGGTESDGEVTDRDSRVRDMDRSSSVKYTPREYTELPANQSEVSFDERLGPVLTARHLTRDLLRMIGLCYGPESLGRLTSDVSESAESGRELDVQGDVMAFRIVDCLVEIARIYGDAFMLLHYFPYCADLIQQGSRRFGPKVEPGLVSSIVLVNALFPYLTDKQLMDNLQETLVDSILFPAVRLASSLRVTFSDQRLRELLVWKLGRAIYVIGVRVGGDNLKRHMAAPLQRLLCAYDLLYKKKEDGRVELKKACENEVIKDQKLMDQLQGTFSPSFVIRLYKLFSGICGKRYFYLSLPNSDLIMALVESENPGMVSEGSQTQWPGSPMKNEPFGMNKLMSGNRLSSVDSSPIIADLVDDQTEPAIYKKLPPSKRHLRGNWLAHWEHELGNEGRRDKEEKLTVNQIKLMSFAGHTSAVKQLVVLDNENSFLSGSQDKTVRLWSLRSFGDGTGRKEAQWIYKSHKKGILDLCLVDSMRLVASTDNIMHIWDPFMGKTLREVDWTGPMSTTGEVGAVSVLRTFKSPSSVILAAGSADSTLKFFDVRQGKWANELKLSPSPLGSVKTLATDPDGCWAAVGHSTGHVSVVDLRTGKLLASKRIAEMEISMMEACSRDRFVLGLNDNPMTVWNVGDCSLRCKLPGPSENVVSVALYYSQLVCGTLSNRIRVYPCITSEANFIESKLRSDVFSGSVSALSLLNLNRLLLLGSTNGVIQLLC